MNKIILAISMFFTISTASSAENNSALNSISASQLESMEIAIEDVSLPAPAYAFIPDLKAPLITPALDLSVKLPFDMINERIAEVKEVSLINPARPILKSGGDYLVLNNIVINVNGILVEPVILIKPWFEGNNKLAIKVLKIDIDVIIGPKAAFPAVINKDEVMSYVIDMLTNSITENMEKALIINKVPLKAQDILVFSYDKKSWTLRADLSPNFIAPLLPGLIDNVNLTAFGFDDEGFIMSVNSGAAKIKQYEGYNLAFSDGLVTKFIRKYTKDAEIDLTSKVNNGGIKFKANGRMEIIGKIKMDNLPFNPDVYFTAEIKPIVTELNTIRLSIEKMEVDKVYGMDLLGSIVNIMEKRIISTVIDNIAGNKELAKVITAKKINKKTVELKLKNSAFLPSFAKGVAINNLLINHGLMYLDFAF